jgi:uncharacterized protein YigE (DUF2233 family)
MFLIFLCTALAALVANADDTAEAVPDALPPVYLERMVHEGIPLDVVRVDLARAKLRLHWQKADGKRIGSLVNLKKMLAEQGEEMLFATNAGIFRPGFVPGGLHVQDGVELVSLNLRDGKGNFHLQPNGVFYIDEHGADVVTSQSYSVSTDDLLVATQSGPMLVIDGAIHPAFREDSEHKRVRSGVGVQSPTVVYFVLSRELITFHHLARFFRDALHCNDALYLDGDISSFYVPGEIENLGLGLYAGMLAATVPATGAGETEN